MSTPTKERAEPIRRPRRTWVPVLAVSALVVAVAGGIVFTGGGDEPTAPLALNAGGEDVFASCIAFSPAELDKVAEIAFEGTVTSVSGSTVALVVDTWYRGDEAAEVVLSAPAGLEALIGGIPFAEGEKYLISAQGGNVNYCGFSGPSTPEYRTTFEQAFSATG